MQLFCPTKTIKFGINNNLYLVLHVPDYIHVFLVLRPNKKICVVMVSCQIKIGLYNRQVRLYFYFLS